MPAEEDDRPRIAVRGEMLLQIKAACSGQADIKDQATRAISQIGVQQLLRRSKAACVDSHRQQKLFECGADLLVVVHDQDERPLHIVGSDAHGKAG